MGFTAAQNISQPGPLNMHTLLFMLLAFCAFTSALPSPTPASSGSHSHTGKDEVKDGKGDTESPKAKVTTAPIYLPHYDEDDWSVVRGSIVSSNASASETTYTIFCPTETSQACQMSLEFPFVIVEGPKTVKFEGTVTSSYTANLACELNGTVAATCSGYSSIRSNYSYGPFSGPIETSWTSTLRGGDVEWGTLTLEEPPTTTDGGGMGVPITTGGPAFVSSGDLYYEPSPTDDGSAAVRVDRSWVATVVAGMAIAGFVI